MMSSSEPPAISVVMPVYNGAAFVERAVASMTRQTFPHWELLAVDDGSTDGSPEILARLAAAEPRLRIFHHAVNAGISAARNTALRAARGEFVTYLDMDDEFYPDHMQRVWEWRSRGDVLVFGYDLVEERPGHPEYGRTRTYDPAPHHARLMQQHIVVPLGVAHRRALLDRVGLFDEALGQHQGQDEDSDLWRRFAGAGARFTFVPAKSGRYHVRADSHSRSLPPAPLPPGGLPTSVVDVEVKLGEQRHRLRMPRGDAELARSLFEQHKYGGLPSGILRKPPVILDVGAHVGTFALYARLFYHPGAVVHCFEPYPPCIDLLRENLAGLPDVHVHPVALGAQNGQADMLLDPSHSVANSLRPALVRQPAGRVRVPVQDAAAAWDELGLAEVDVLKVDAEGSEVDILRRLGERLGRVRVVLVEFHTRQDRRRIDALLSGHELFGAALRSVDVGVLKYLRADLVP